MTLYEYYNIADPAMTWVHGAFWQGQTFTPQTAHRITSLKLLMYRYGLPGELTVSIKATDGEGHPTGADLCFGITDGNILPNVYSGEWREVSLGEGAVLSEGIKYAIVVRGLAGNQNNYVRWLSSTAKPYTRGAHEFSSNSGVSWDTNEARDMKFKEYGEAV